MAISAVLVRAGLLCAVAAFAMPAGTTASIQETRPDTSLKATLSAARTYLAQYQIDLTFILADEDATQRVIRQDPPVQDAPTTRTTRGEVYFKYIETDGEWMAIRNVGSVNGVAVDDRPDLRAALLNQPTAQVARSFKAFNSKFNIGRILRTFNEPTLALGVLDPSRAAAFEFTRKGARTRNGVTTVTVGFKERRGAAPFISDLLMRPASVEGELVVEAGMGRVWGTVLKVTLGSVKAELTTEYERDLKTDLWVPVSFEESYQAGVELSGTARLHSGVAYEAIRCESRYSNFRRFTATVRIK